MSDDLERRAIIAAHDAACPDRCEVTVMPSLSKREQAIVTLWRADVTEKSAEVDDKSRVGHAAADAWMDKAHEAESAIKRVRSLVRQWDDSHDWSDNHCHEGYRIPNHDDCDSDCLHCAAAGVRWMLDHAEEATG